MSPCVGGSVGALTRFVIGPVGERPLWWAALPGQAWRAWLHRFLWAGSGWSLSWESCHGLSCQNEKDPRKERKEPKERDGPQNNTSYEYEYQGKGVAQGTFVSALKERLLQYLY